MLSKTYHKALGFPAGAAVPRPGMVLDYSFHAIREASLDGVRAAMLPERLPTMFDVVELTTFGGLSFKWVVRFPLLVNQEGRAVPTGHDLVLAVSLQRENTLTVRTAWLNAHDDIHMTLRCERYTAPEKR